MMSAGTQILFILPLRVFVLSLLVFLDGGHGSLFYTMLHMAESESFGVFQRLSLPLSFFSGIKHSQKPQLTSPLPPSQDSLLAKWDWLIPGAWPLCPMSKIGFFLIYLYFIHLFLAVLGLCCCARAFSSCGEQGLLFVAVRGLLIAVASLVAEHGL